MNEIFNCLTSMSKINYEKITPNRTSRIKQFSLHIYSIFKKTQNAYEMVTSHVNAPISFLRSTSDISSVISILALPQMIVAEDCFGDISFTSDRSTNVGIVSDDAGPTSSWLRNLSCTLWSLVAKVETEIFTLIVVMNVQYI